MFAHTIIWYRRSGAYIAPRKIDDWFTREVFKSGEIYSPLPLFGIVASGAYIAPRKIDDWFTSEVFKSGEIYSPLPLFGIILAGHILLRGQ